MSILQAFFIGVAVGMMVGGTLGAVFMAMAHMGKDS